ncbi:probable protein phosphatase 2C 65 [Primulina eburnea]|uniref:probable protein phosphatase 2C 65 n=1 Tax=Primulina eburnea TaxID=1245227 RepID=UPI003C6BE56A
MGACCSCQRGGNFEGFLVEGEEHERDFDDENIVLTREAGARVRLQGSSKYVSMFSQQGKKGINQDAMTVWESFSGDKDMLFCGVFDGHGPSGHKVARYIRENLPTKISSLYRQPSVEGNDCALDVENYDDCENPDFKNPYFLSWKARLIKCFHEVDEELENEVSIESYCSGTTTVSVLKKGEHLIISNLGDSRAVLCTRDETDELIAEQLTVDLKPNLPSETQRIRSCQGRVMAMDEEPNVYRIWMPHEDCPGLAMARAFGDFCLKDFGLISTPEVTYRKLTERDEFVVLATDGIWDVLSNNEVVRIVASSRKRSMAAKYLVDHAVRAWRYKYPRAKIDDCAVVCLFFKRQRPVLTKSVSEMSELSFNQTYSYGKTTRNDDGLDTVLNWEGDGNSENGGNGSNLGPNRMKKRRQGKNKLENVEK